MIFFLYISAIVIFNIIRMKNLIILLLLISFTQLSAQTEKEAWTKLYPEIQKNIKAPTFGKEVYNIAGFGAVANDPAVLNHASINRAIATCSANGGGTVLVPAGVWHTGPITMKSNVNLRVGKGATILFTADTKYFNRVLTRWEGLDCYNLQPLIYAYGETNIAITGEGTIDGAAENENWWKKCGAPHYGWKEGDISQRTGRPKLLKWGDDKVPVEERVFTVEDGMRPQLINFYLCKNILIEGVTLLRSPFWVIHPLLSENITVRGVTITNDGPNGDGCDPESCKNVLIEKCFFNTGDDCIAIKSGRNNDGRRWNVPSENIIVRDCEMRNGHGGVVIGSEISGGYKNLFVENCKMDSPELERVLRIKTNTLRGGLIENIYFRNVEVGVCKRAVISVNLLYEPKEIGQRGFMPTVRNIHVDGVTCNKSQYGIYLNGLEDQQNISGIFVTNCNFSNVESGNFVQGKVMDVHLENLKINGELVKELK